MFTKRRSFRRRLRVALLLIFSLLAHVVCRYKQDYKKNSHIELISNASELAQENYLIVTTSVQGLELSVDHDKHVVTLNSLRSFENLLVTRLLVLLVDDPRLCNKKHLIHIGLYRTICVRVELNAAFQRPTMDVVFRNMAVYAEHFDVLFINSDIVLTNNDLGYARDYAKSRGSKYVITGRRIDLDVSEKIDFSDDAQVLRVSEKAKLQGKLHGKFGLDYFLFSPEALALIRKEISPFIIGVYRWDNVLLTQLMLHSDVLVYDASDVVQPVHQGTVQHNHLAEAASRYNQKLAEKAVGHAYLFGNTDNIRLKIPRL